MTHEEAVATVRRNAMHHDDQEERERNMVAYEGYIRSMERGRIAHALDWDWDGCTTAAKYVKGMADDDTGTTT